MSLAVLCASILGVLVGIDAYSRFRGSVREGLMMPSCDTAIASRLQPTLPKRDRLGGRPPGITLALAGDVMLEGVADPFVHVRRVLRSADLSFCNLECPLSSRGAPIPWKLRNGSLLPNEFLFQAEPQSVVSLAKAGIKVVSLANNHIMDYGGKALQDTLHWLNRQAVKHAGAGPNTDAAQREAIVLRSGLRIAFLAFVAADTLPAAQNFAATSHRAGVALVRPNRTQQPDEGTMDMLSSDIATARRVADLVIVSFHWGEERSNFPTEFQKRLAHQAIDLGADLVVGHHPHCLQGVEAYRGKPILYSLGNFVFPSKTELAQRSCIAWLKVDIDGVKRIAFRPISIQDAQPHLADKLEADHIVMMIQRLSRSLGTQVTIGRLDDRQVAYLNLSHLRQATSVSIRQGLSTDLVDVHRVAPEVLIDLRYATLHNVFHTRFYESQRCLLRRGTAMKLKCAQEILAPSGLRLKIWDAFRPLSVQRRMWQQVRDKRYVADPKAGSSHNRAAAVDVTLVDNEGHELAMPSGFDNFSRRSLVDNSGPANRNRGNALLLRHVMTAAGFTPLTTEWWHFADRDATRYALVHSELTLQNLQKHPP